MRGHNVCFYGEKWKIIPKLSPYPVLFEALHNSEVHNICFMYLLIANDPCHEVYDRLIIAWHKVKTQI